MYPLERERKINLLKSKYSCCINQSTVVSAAARRSEARSREAQRRSRGRQARAGAQEPGICLRGWSSWTGPGQANSPSSHVAPQRPFPRRPSPRRALSGGSGRRTPAAAVGPRRCPSWRCAHLGCAAHPSRALKAGQDPRLGPAGPGPPKGRGSGLLSGPRQGPRDPSATTNPSCALSAGRWSAQEAPGPAVAAKMNPRAYLVIKKNLDPGNKKLIFFTPVMPNAKESLLKETRRSIFTNEVR